MWTSPTSDLHATVDIGSRACSRERENWLKWCEIIWLFSSRFNLPSLPWLRFVLFSRFYLRAMSHECYRQPEQRFTTTSAITTSISSAACTKIGSVRTSLFQLHYETHWPHAIYHWVASTYTVIASGSVTLTQNRILVRGFLLVYYLIPYYSFVGNSLVSNQCLLLFEL